MKEDLVEAGVKQSEITPILEGHDGANNANADFSDEDSADRRKRILLAAKGTKTLVAGQKGKSGQK